MSHKNSHTLGHRRHLLPSLLYTVDGVAGLAFGIPSLLFSHYLSSLVGLPQTLVHKFLLVYTCYGGLVLWGLRRPSGDGERVPPWLTTTALGINAAFLGAVGYVMEGFKREVTPEGWWILRGMLGMGACVTGGIVWTAGEHYREEGTRGSQ